MLITLNRKVRVLTSMSIKDHLTSDETVLDHCTTDYWAWVCTNSRIIKYRSDGGRTERLHEISLSEIRGISLVKSGRSDTLLGYLIFSVIGVLGSLYFAILTNPTYWVGVILLFGVAYTLYGRWKNSAEGYFELKGTGLIQQEPEKWRIRSGGSPDDVRSFVKTIRNNI